MGWPVLPGQLVPIPPCSGSPEPCPCPRPLSEAAARPAGQADPPCALAWAPSGLPRLSPRPAVPCGYGPSLWPGGATEQMLGMLPGPVQLPSTPHPCKILPSLPPSGPSLPCVPVLVPSLQDPSTPDCFELTQSAWLMALDTSVLWSSPLQLIPSPVPASSSPNPTVWSGPLEPHIPEVRAPMQGVPATPTPHCPSPPPQAASWAPGP